MLAVPFSLNILGMADSLNVFTGLYYGVLLCGQHIPILFCSLPMTLPQFCLVFSNALSEDFFTSEQMGMGGIGGWGLYPEAPCGAEVMVIRL